MGDPRDDPKTIAAKYAKEVNETIDGAAQVATDAYEKINAQPPTFGTQDAIKSLFDLTKVAIKGAADIAVSRCRRSPILVCSFSLTTSPRWFGAACSKRLRSPRTPRRSSTRIQRASTETNW